MKKQENDRSRSKSRSRSREKKKMWTERQYDDFLQVQKKNTFKRLDPFKSLSSHIRHECAICFRIWKPSPSMCLKDDYFCPSCVLHHRNNMQRFIDPKLQWTAVVPNTFYVYKIEDNVTHESFLKYGRTQHLSSQKRYSKTERNRYKMQLIYEVRGPLINTTAVENFWKSVANDLKLKPTFSEKDFHGATQCIRINSEIQKFMIDESKEILKRDLKGFKKFTFKDIPPVKAQELQGLIQKFTNPPN